MLNKKEFEVRETAIVKQEFEAMADRLNAIVVRVSKERGHEIFGHHINLDEAIEHYILKLEEENAGFRLFLGRVAQELLAQFPYRTNGENHG